MENYNQNFFFIPEIKDWGYDLRKVDSEEKVKTEREDETFI